MIAAHLRIIKFQSVKVDGVYTSEGEVTAVKALQEFLRNETNNNKIFIDALAEGGLTRENIEQNGTFTRNTAVALAIWLSVKNNTWATEKKGQQLPRMQL